MKDEGDFVFVNGSWFERKREVESEELDPTD